MPQLKVKVSFKPTQSSSPPSQFIKSHHHCLPQYVFFCLFIIYYLPSMVLGLDFGGVV